MKICESRLLATDKTISRLLLASILAGALVSFLNVTFAIRHNSIKSQLCSTERQNEANVAELKQFYTKSINSEVAWDNKKMGCSDLNVIAPYVRIVMDRYNYERRQLIFDVGANRGQDSSMIFGVFQQVIGMCKSYAKSFKVVAIEPSPKVFCELEEHVQRRNWAPSEILRLNIGLSDKSGVVEFADPGNEGGSLEGDVVMELPEFSDQDLERMTSCLISDQKSYSVAGQRTFVNTYTMDQLVESLELASIHEIDPADHILMVKIDTEGHDLHVIRGSKHLLANNRISFVLFEVWTNKNLKAIVEFMDRHDYLCFIIFPTMLVPVHAVDWWYPHLDNFTSVWWGNGFCGIRDSPSLSLLYKAFHADSDFLTDAYHVVMKRSTPLTHTAR